MRQPQPFFGATCLLHKRTLLLPIVRLETMDVLLREFSRGPHVAATYIKSMTKWNCRLPARARKMQRKLGLRTSSFSDIVCKDGVFSVAGLPASTHPGHYTLLFIEDDRVCLAHTWSLSSTVPFLVSSRSMLVACNRQMLAHTTLKLCLVSTSALN
ncbi:hypothetical protein K431DRAFT_113848 [Polychaeton citri CBS 116435]|uniref:Uncharacterized protein n=1 Tax=Polychaeton citri CBS 116435 TaxID=1314669 RepID=A0A9P4Q6E1_9PEZI|nr:hypothetical protein K431DRAFT_113848 [Polychaeton citri CBS 116435]